jgi:hypothetical protein
MKRLRQFIQKTNEKLPGNFSGKQLLRFHRMVAKA